MRKRDALLLLLLLVLLLLVLLLLLLRLSLLCMRLPLQLPLPVALLPPVLLACSQGCLQKRRQRKTNHHDRPGVGQPTAVHGRGAGLLCSPGSHCLDRCQPCPAHKADAGGCMQRMSRTQRCKALHVRQH